MKNNKHARNIAVFAGVAAMGLAFFLQRKQVNAGLAKKLRELRTNSLLNDSILEGKILDASDEASIC